MTRRRVNVVTMAVALAITMLVFGGIAWATGTVGAPDRPHVTEFNPVPPTPTTPTGTTTTTTVPTPAPVPVPAPAPVPHVERRSSTPAPAPVVTPPPAPVVVGPATVVEKPPCPSDGTTFPYGSCELPDGVHDAGADISLNGEPVAAPGVPSKIVAGPCGGLVLRPASYTPPEGTLTCDPPVGAATNG